MMKKRDIQSANTIRQGIAKMETSATNTTAITTAKKRSAETNTAQKDTQELANILQET